MKDSSKRKNARKIPKYIDENAALAQVKAFAEGDGYAPVVITRTLKAFNGDIEAIISIFLTIQTFLELEPEFDALYLDWYKQMLVALREKKSVSAITNIPKKQGRTRDLLLDRRDQAIWVFVYCLSQSYSQRESLDAVQYFIDESGHEEYKDGLANYIFYSKGNKKYKPIAEKRLQQIMSDQLVDRSDAIDLLVEECKSAWYEFMYIKNAFEEHSWELK